MCVTTLGLAHHHHGDVPFGIKASDRHHHVLALGQTGTGKSTLLRSMALSDAKAGNGFCLIDPHGDLALSVHEAITRDHLYWDVADPSCPLGYNPLSKVSASLRPLVAAGYMETLRHQWSDAWGPRMETLLRWALLALLELPHTDFTDIMPLMTNREFRKEVVHAITDEEVRRFWKEEFPALSYKTAFDGVAPIANKLGTFLAHPVLRKSLATPETPIRFRQLMDRGDILIVNLRKGRLGSDAANVMGGLILTAIRNAAFTREDQPERLRKPFYVSVDEFHNFTSETIAESLSELRKYRVSLTLAQQHSSQSSTETREALLGNVGTAMIFRLGVGDAPLFSRYLQSATERDLLNLPTHQAYVRLMVDGVQSRTFSMKTLPP